MKKLLAVTIAAASISALASAPAFARTEVYLDFAPPAAPYEEVPPPRVGFIWAPGYYEHDHGRYHWKAGHWEHERHGYTYHGGAWDHRENHWYYSEPRWERSGG
jgi:hypothetical protein